MSDVVGTLRKITLKGRTFDVMADANVTGAGSKYENTGIATSGRTLRKMAARVMERDGVDLAINALEAEALKAMADSQESIAMSYQLASGETYTATGFIEFAGRESDTGKGTVKMIPQGDWHLFAA